MIKIAHSADLHVGKRYTLDALKALNYIKEKSIQEKCQVKIIAGDFWDNILKVEKDSPLVKSIDIIKEIGEKMPILFVYGNHDPDTSLDVFSRLLEPGRIYVSARKEIELVVLEEGKFFKYEKEIFENRVKANILQPPDAFFFTIPYPYQNDWLDEDEMTEDIGVMSQKVDQKIREKLLELDSSILPEFRKVPKIVAAHGTYKDCKKSHEQEEVVREKEYSFTDKTLLCMNPQYVALGHIHLYQRLPRKTDGIIVYPSSTYPVNFSESDNKFFMTVEIDDELDTNIIANSIPKREIKVIEKTYETGYDSFDFNREINDLVDELRESIDKYLYKVVINAPRLLTQHLTANKNDPDIKIACKPTDIKLKITREVGEKEETQFELFTRWLKKRKDVDMSDDIKEIYEDIELLASEIMAKEKE